MSARVNLLPREIEERARARRTASWVIAGVLIYAALLLLLYIVKLGDVGRARDERELAEAEVAQLESDLADLEEFAQLDREVTARNSLLSSAMATEISWARVLNDLALTFPPSSSLIRFEGGGAGAVEAGVAEAPAPNPNSESIASVTFEGYSVERFAPGVERVLVKFEEAEIFFNPYLSQAADQLRGDTTVTGFDGTLQLNDDAYTGRYTEGLPPEVGR